MAAAATESGGSGIFWKNSGVGGKAKIPLNLRQGSTSDGNKRGSRTHKSNGKKETTLKKEDKRQHYSESDCAGVYHQDGMSATRAKSICEDSGDFHPTAKVLPEPNRAKSAIGLKDLCPDDKRRIANLVEELARVSEEKEVSVQRLKDEHQNFEQKIQKLEKRNVTIAQERESLQHQYRECQELLGLYQQYLSLQQVKLNQSIAQLSQEPALSKELSGEEAVGSAASCGSNGAYHDGSYLGFAASGPRGPRVRGREAAPAHGEPASPPPAAAAAAAAFSPGDGPSRRQTCQAREPHPDFHHSCPCCRCQVGCHGAQQRRCDEGPCRKSRPSEEFKHHGCESTIPEAPDTLTTPVLGHKDWEEKRHRLLLQKMQLEVERERLQVRLAEQEETLSRQKQPSRLHSSRDQQADLSRSYSGNGGLQMEASVQHQRPTRNQPDGHTVAADGGSSSLGKLSHTEPALADREEPLKGSRKDTGTSPGKSSVNSSKAEPASASQEPPQSSTELSVVELLDIMSPVSAPKPTRGQAQPSRQRVSKTPRPGDGALLTPTWSHHQQHQEESQILEDIFFIC